MSALTKLGWVILACHAAAGAPVAPSSATHFVEGWLARDPAPLGERIGHKVRSVETVRNTHGTALYHVVHLSPTGFVVVAADDRMEPIVAFGGNGDFNISATNALKALADKDLTARLGQGWLTPPPPGPTPLATNVSTVRVAPFLQTLWDQTTVGHDTGVACYNYYTPPYAAGNADNYPCGCVATSLAQLMYYFQYPAVGVGAGSFGIGINGSQAYANLRGGDGAGGPYVWSNMPPNPQNITTAQCQAIGALTYDAGVSINMAYTAGNSQSTLLAASQSLAGTFLYANAIMGGQDNPNYSLSSVLVNMVNPNLDARLPVMLGIWASPAEGHCVLCDGYGYIGAVLYHHLNLGYSGIDNSWYALPDINTVSELNYTNISSCVYNVYAGGAGEIISGRIVDGSGNPVPGATVTASGAAGDDHAATSDTNGIYALAGLPSSSTFTVTATQAGYADASGQWSTAVSRNSSGATGNVWGANFVLTASGPPAILLAPQSQTVLAGATAVFSATAAGAGVLTYQWSQNGFILGDSGSSLTIPGASAANAGTYTVVVGNAEGTATNAGAVLNVEQAGGEQLVQNGGFETGGFADWQGAGNTADTFVSAGALYVHAGNYGAALGPSGSLGFLTQNIPTAAGAAYLLSCWLDSPDGETPSEWVVSWNGTNLMDTVNMGAIGWINLQFLVAASAALTPLEFGFRNDNSYFGLDAITVNNLVPATAAPGLAAQLNNGGQIVLTLTNLPAQGTIVVQASTNLALWIPVFTNAAGAGGLAFTDAPPASFPCRYYRAVLSP